MKNYLFIIILVSGCAHIRINNGFQDIYLEKEDKYISARLCKQPIPLFEDSISYEERAIIRQGLDYWSSIVKVKSDDYAVVVFKSKKKVGHYTNMAEAENIISKETGCIHYSTVEFFYDLTLFSEWDAQRLVRHELGHVYGLSDSYRKHHLMYYTFDVLGDPILSEWELNAIKEIYK